jgi:hypothetical protein
MECVDGRSRGVNYSHLPSQKFGRVQLLFVQHLSYSPHENIPHVRELTDFDTHLILDDLFAVVQMEKKRSLRGPTPDEIICATISSRGSAHVERQALRGWTIAHTSCAENDVGQNGARTGQRPQAGEWCREPDATQRTSPPARLPCNWRSQQFTAWAA